MSNTFMAAYERAEERNDIQHGYFQDKKEEREKERARKKRNQRIAGIAAVGAGLAAAGGLVAYQHSARGKASAASQAESYKNFAAEQDAVVNERKAAEAAKESERKAEKAAKESERKAATAARVNSINQKVGAAATKVQDRIKAGQARRESRRESSVFKSAERASNQKGYTSKLDAELKDRARRYEERERQWDREEMARLRKESDERMKKYGGNRYYR